MPNINDGAAIGVVSVRACVDLAAALRLAAEQIEAAEGDSDPRRRFVQGAWKRDPEGRVTQGNLIFDTVGLMRRVFAAGGFEDLATERPFLQAVAPPKGAFTIKVGGRFTRDSEPAIKAGADRISRAVRGGLRRVFAETSRDGTAPPLAAADLWIAPERLAGHLRRVAGGFGAVLQPKAGFSVQRVRFTETDAPGRSDEIARQMTSYEDVEGGDRARGFLDAAARHYAERWEEDRDDVADDLRGWAEGARTRGSEMHRFLAFLDDEGLSRVRLAVSFRIMDALARAAETRPEAAALRVYVERLFDAYREIVEEARSDVRVDLVRLFGKDADFLISDQLVKASLFRALPVWAVWNTQLYEERPDDTSDSSVHREVCYHFKINGQNPSEGKAAYDARLDAALDRLRTETGTARALAELLLLDAVLPGGEHDGLPAVAAMERRCRDLQACATRDAALDALRRALSARSPTMDAIARELVEVLRTKEADAALKARTAAPVSLYVNVRPTVLNPRAVDTGMSHPLATAAARAGTDAEKVDWFKSIRVTPGAALAGPDTLFSFRVTVTLGDRSARKTGGAVEGTAERLLDERTALVALVPVRPGGGDAHPAYDPAAAGTVRLWRGARGFSVVLTYAPASLGRYRKRRDGADTLPAENRMAVARVVFAAVVQVALEALIDAMGAGGAGAGGAGAGGAGAGGSAPGRVLLLRQQIEGKDAPWDGGDYAVYAVSQAVEHVLGKRLPVKLQGLSSAPNGRDRRARKAFDAALSGFDLRVVRRDGAALPLPKLGVVAFASRPCDTDPAQGPTDEDGHVVIGRTYLAEAEPGGFVLRRGPNLAESHRGADGTGDPSVVYEAVRRLVVEGGCTAVATVSHKFAGRAIGRSAMRHLHHENAEFQAGLARKFPGVVFYPLVRDSMKVVRTRDETARIAFEVLGKDDHIHRYVNDAMREGLWRRGLVPLYSLATLFHVGAGAGGGLRPQSGFATYYLLLTQPWRPGDAAVRAQNALDSESPARVALSDVLRALHLLESEDGAMMGRVRPVLDPASWMSPDTIAGAGEFQVMERRRRSSGNVELSAVAVVAKVASALRATREPRPAPGEDDAPPGAGP